MTRRLVPKERVDELGSASVPFPFDIHMMMYSTNAPALENAIHRALFRERINRANPRKEFFKTDLQAIKEIVTQHGGDLIFETENLVAEAKQYHDSLLMPIEDQEYVESVYDRLAEDGELVEDEV